MNTHLRIIAYLALPLAACASQPPASSSYAVALDLGPVRLSPVHAASTANGVRAMRSGSVGPMAIRTSAKPSEGCATVSFEDKSLSATSQLMTWCTTKTFRIDDALDATQLLALPTSTFPNMTLRDGYQAWSKALAARGLTVVNTGASMWLTRDLDAPRQCVGDAPTFSPQVCRALRKVKALARQRLSCDDVDIPLVGTDWGHIVPPVVVVGCGKRVTYTKYGQAWMTPREAYAARMTSNLRALRPVRALAKAQLDCQAIRFPAIDGMQYPQAVDYQTPVLATGCGKSERYTKYRDRWMPVTHVYAKKRRDRGLPSVPHEAPVERQERTR